MANQLSKWVQECWAAPSTLILAEQPRGETTTAIPAQDTLVGGQAKIPPAAPGPSAPPRWAPEMSVLAGTEAKGTQRQGPTVITATNGGFAAANMNISGGTFTMNYGK